MSLTSAYQNQRVLSSAALSLGVVSEAGQVGFSSGVGVGATSSRLFR